MSAWEIVAALLGVANVLLIIRRSLWNYPFGLAMVALYAVVFWQARLYSDATLQVFFFAIQIYGWLNWQRARSDSGTVPVTMLDNRGRAFWIVGIAAVTVAEGWYLATYTIDASPWLDAVATILSVAAQCLLSIRKIENWLLWVLADVIQIGLYTGKGLYLTAALYAVFLGLCGFGLAAWRLQLAVQRQVPA